MGGFHLNSKGYPVWNNSGKLVHRTVAKPRGNQVTHHIDGNPMNFRKSNLINMNPSKHMKLHARERRHFQ